MIMAGAAHTNILKGKTGNVFQDGILHWSILAIKFSQGIRAANIHFGSRAGNV
jgi:hypothetical protein